MRLKKLLLRSLKSRLMTWRPPSLGGRAGGGERAMGRCRTVFTFPKHPRLSLEGLRRPTSKCEAWRAISSRQDKGSLVSMCSAEGGAGRWAEVTDCWCCPSGHKRWLFNLAETRIEPHTLIFFFLFCSYFSIKLSSEGSFTMNSASYNLNQSLTEWTTNRRCFGKQNC